MPKTVTSFDIANKIATIITDNNANMVKAFSLPGMEDLSNPDDNELTEDDTDVIITDEYDFLPPHRSPCCANTLQHVVKDGLDHNGPLKATIAKVSKLVAHCRKSTISTEALDGCLKLQMANATQWNSHVTMLKSMLKVPPHILSALQESSGMKLTA